MAKYVCSICGYIYDEEREGKRFDELDKDWKCPLCKADKSAFNKEAGVEEKPVITKKNESPSKQKGELTNGELFVMMTNLAKGAEKQYRAEESQLFLKLASYYEANLEKSDEKNLLACQKLLDEDLTENFPIAFENAKEDGDRGALRALTWSDKVSKMAQSLLSRYKNEGIEFLKNTKIFVCEICGFIYLGDEAPDICPVCKVPKLKIHEVGRE